MLTCWKSGTVWPFPNRAQKPCLLRLPGSSMINEVFQLRHRSLLTWSRCGLVFGAALPFPHNWEKILIFSVFWFCGCFVLVYWKAKNINLHCYLPASSSEPSDCMISDNRGIYDVTSQKTTADSPESVSQPQARGRCRQDAGCRRWPRWPAQGQHFGRRLVLLWGKLHEHSDKRRKKKVF